MPEETENYIRIPVADCKITATIDISKKEGIKALYCGIDKKVATYLFAKDEGWTMEKAKQWVKEHKKKSADDSNIEYRYLPKAELRVQDDTGKKKIIGHAAMFNSLSEELWGFRERIMPGAFKRTLAEGADVRALINHNPSLILGRNKAGTLDLKEDERGLFCTIDPPDTTAGKDIIESINRRDIDGMSIGFLSVDEKWIKEGGANVRELMDVDLVDISIVTYPAYTATKVMTRSMPQMARELSGIFMRTEKGLELDADDRSIIDKAIIRLQNLKRGATPNLDERLQKLDILKK